MDQNGSDDKGGGAWHKVPQWDGSPATWRAFRKEMTWWISSLDLTSTSKYNLAARWLIRQTGIVRARGEEFEPSDLEALPAETAVDPQTGEKVILRAADPLAGLNKLLKALEEINGLTQLDKRGELRTQFYTDLRRRPGERMSEFCSRFRSLVAELRLEGVQLPSTELGWFLRDKAGLDSLRRQLLDTALQGKEDHSLIEAELLRLFKDLHLADPLRRFGGGPDVGGRPKLTIRKLFQSTAPSSTGSDRKSVV